jgi:hypothetical protein
VSIFPELAYFPAAHLAQRLPLTKRLPASQTYPQFVASGREYMFSSQAEQEASPDAAANPAMQDSHAVAFGAGTRPAGHGVQELASSSVDISPGAQDAQPLLPSI